MTEKKNTPNTFLLLLLPSISLLYSWLQSPPHPPPQRHRRMGAMGSVHNSSSLHLFHPTLFPCSRADPPWTALPWFITTRHSVGTLKVKPGCNPDPQKILVEPCWIWQQTEITRTILEWKKNQLLNPQFPERNIPDKHLKDHQGLARMPALLMWKRPCLWISK